MSRAHRGDVASPSDGIRPTSAFVLTGCVLIAVAASAFRMAFLEAGEQPDTSTVVEAPWPEYRIVDRNGEVLAMSVESFDVTASPRSLWRAHTPWRIADGMSERLGRDPEDLLLDLLPHSARETGGWLQPERPELVRLDEAGRDRALAWIEDGAPHGGGSAPLEGVEVVPLPVAGLEAADPRLHRADGAGWTLRWRPDVLLAADVRAEHMGEGRRGRPDLWTRQLLRHLGEVLELIDAEGHVVLERLPGHMAGELRPLLQAERRGALYDALWAELMPCTFRVVDRNVDAIRAEALHGLFGEEGVSDWQVQLRPRLDRRHPQRPGGTARRPMGEGELDREDAFGVVGHWGVLGPAEAGHRADTDLRLRPHLLDWEATADPFDAYVAELLSQQRPWSGIELLCGELLASTHWQETLVVRPRAYERQRRSLARDRRGIWRRDAEPVPDYYGRHQAAADEPIVEVTLDATLQGVLHEELESLMDSSGAALVMGICVEVSSGEVLAVDAITPYAISGFAPTQHRFTPGSTFKPLIMAAALEGGHVRPEDRFQCFGEKGIVLQEGRSRRAIGEAEGVPEPGKISASWALAKSVNAVLVQIGMKVPAHELRAALVDLGYGRRPGAGIGPETGGMLPRLVEGTWSPLYTHASVSFGHEVAVTLWQHAAGLATLARGGEYRPLTLLRAIEQQGVRHELEPTPLSPVFSERTCDQVLAMMAEGAELGTGRHVASREDVPELAWIGTKTGTTQKERGVVCLHTQFAHRQQHRRDGTPCTEACREANLDRDHRGCGRRSCYTSSMCAVGRLPGGEDVMVFVVVDDRAKGGRFGSDVAGPTTVRVLRRALGLGPAHDESIVSRPAHELERDAFEIEAFPWRGPESQR